jgi:toxin ParE1/3/4
MKFNCRYKRQAKKDLENIALYISENNPPRALSFVDELQAHCEDIAENPNAYSLREEYGIGVRMTVHGNYLIFHTMLDNELTIERIIHAARQREGIVPERK